MMISGVTIFLMLTKLIMLPNYDVTQHAPTSSLERIVNPVAHAYRRIRRVVITWMGLVSVSLDTSATTVSRVGK